MTLEEGQAKHKEDFFFFFIKHVNAFEKYFLHYMRLLFFSPLLRHKCINCGHKLECEKLWGVNQFGYQIQNVNFKEKHCLK